MIAIIGRSLGPFTPLATSIDRPTYYAAPAVAQCTITGAAGEKYEAGRLGGHMVGEGGELISGPAKIVTPENVDELKFYLADDCQCSRR